MNGDPFGFGGPASTGYTPATRPSAAPTAPPSPERGSGAADGASGTAEGRTGAAGVPEELVRPLAEKLRADYDKEFDASHLSWQDFAGQARRLLDVVMPIHEDFVRVKAAAELIERARQYAGKISGPAGSFRRGLEAAARHIMPKLTPEQLAEKIRTGEAFLVVCDIPEDPAGGV